MSRCQRSRQRCQGALELSADDLRFCHRLLDHRRRAPAIVLRLELTSIYGYLRNRMGDVSYRTGSAIFIISRLLGLPFASMWC